MQLEIALREGPVALRPLKAEDASLLLRWLTDPAVLEWYEGRGRPFTPQMVQEHFYKEDGLSRCIILYEGSPAGYVQVYPLDEGEKQAYGCPEAPSPAFAMDQFLGETACWGKRIGRAFISLLLKHLAAAENAQAVYVDPHTDNKRAIRCYEACGFRQVKLLPKHELHEGSMRDCWLMECRPQETE